MWKFHCNGLDNNLHYNVSYDQESSTKYSFCAVIVNLWLLLFQEQIYGQQLSLCLFDWAEALMLECQVALRDFSNALKLRNPFVMFKV